MPAIKRRDFLKTLRPVPPHSPSPTRSVRKMPAPSPTGDRIIIGLMGAGGRGTQIAGTFACASQCIRQVRLRCR